MIRHLLIPCLGAALLAGCGPSYAPDTYATNAAQQANKTEQGMVIGVRPVKISAAGTVGTVTGAAAGGIAGSQAVAAPISAFTALGGSLVGGIAGSAAEHAMEDTDAFEYIIRKTNNELVSVTQKDKTPLALGQKVLVIAGNQARVVPDYTVHLEGETKPQAAAASGRPAAGTVAAQPTPADAATVAPVPPAEGAAATAPKPADAAGSVAAVPQTPLATPAPGVAPSGDTPKPAPVNMAPASEGTAAPQSHL